MITHISFDFKTISGPAAVAFASNVQTRMSGNPKFASILTPLLDTELPSAIQLYEQLLQESADGSHTKIIEKNIALVALRKVVEKTATYVAIISNGNDALIVEAGFNLRNRGSRRLSKVLEQVSGQRAKQGAQPGEAIVEYNTVAGALLYAIEWSADNGQTWQIGAHSSTRRAFLTGLPVRQDILIRVYALGPQQRKGTASGTVSLFLI